MQIDDATVQRLGEKLEESVSDEQLDKLLLRVLKLDRDLFEELLQEFFETRRQRVRLAFILGRQFERDPVDWARTD